MPYIKQAYRDMIDPVLNPLVELLIDPSQFGLREKAGVLNYIITRLCKRVFEDDKRYDTANSLIGALECSKLELYRRIIGNYENEAIIKNGDII